MVDPSGASHQFGVRHGKQPFHRYITAGGGVASPHTRRVLCFHSAMCGQGGPDDEDLQWHRRCHTFVGGGETFSCVFCEFLRRKGSEMSTKVLLFHRRKNEIWSWLQRSVSRFSRRIELWPNRMTTWRNKWDKSQRRSDFTHSVDRGCPIHQLQLSSRSWGHVGSRSQINKQKK